MFRSTRSIDVPAPCGEFHRARRQVLAVMLCAATLLAWTARNAGASDTQWWIVDDANEHAESVLRGVTVGPEGALQLGPRSSSTTADSLGTIWAIAILKDGAVALAGDRGRIDRWTAGGGVRPWVRLAAGQVLSLASDGNGLLAGTGPDGVIYRVGAGGDTSTVVRTGERYVWGLAAGARGVWYAATGTRGRLLKIEGGHVRIVLDTDESNLVSIVADGAGGVYAGGDSKGRVVQVRADGSTRTVFDAPEDEVRALAIGRDGAIYAAGLSAAAVTGAVPATPAAAAGAGDDGPTLETEVAAAPTPTRAPGGRSTLYRIVPDSSVATWWTVPQSLIYALAVTPAGIVVATGNRAAVYVVPGVHSGVAWLTAPQGQITSLAVGHDGTVFAAASNPCAVWRIGPDRAERGTLESPVFDARRLARWGRIVWHGPAKGHVELDTRSGNSDPPDTTWTAWRRPGGDDRIASPPGRYVQWRITLTGATTRVEAVDVAWREQNLAPRVEDVVVAPQAQAFREGDLVPRTDPVTQTLPGGQKVEYSIPSPTTPRQLRELPAWAAGIRTVQWKGSDPNGDPLRYTVAVAGSLDGPWTEIATNLEAPSFTWDTHTLGDGDYRVRVTASDAPGNANGEEAQASAVSEPFRIDNTPPAIGAFDATVVSGGVRLEGTARDAQSPLSRIEVAMDNDDWRPVTPDSGFTDDLAAAFHVTIRGVKPGDHQFGLRVVDLAGNSVTRARHVTVPAAR